MMEDSNMAIYHDRCQSCGCTVNRYEVEDENDVEYTTFSGQCGCQSSQDYYDDHDYYDD